ncbi:unnamed protein product [Nippostrongylus brasiliensis]|uniref:HTH_Tnp_4 domain-containing protein n=1 Tax=Nippostrongylus brasiliensis TaxID=27835 RepID=A0A0N4YPT9_NIPBR|nr:unnamed protein product [Nippostrongylus brasiliensis]
MKKVELARFYRTALQTTCRKCRAKRLKYCRKAIAACVAVAQTDGDKVESRRTRWYTRLRPEEFMELHERIAHRIEHARCHRAPISTKHTLSITLRLLGHGSSFVTTAQEFSVGRSTVKQTVYECCRAIVAGLMTFKDTKVGYENNSIQIYRTRLFRPDRGDMAP